MTEQIIGTGEARLRRARRHLVAAVAISTAALLARATYGGPVDAATNASAAAHAIRTAPQGVPCNAYELQPTLDPNTLPDLSNRKGWVVSHNVLRQTVGLQPLTESVLLDGTAQQTAEYLAATSRFEHTWMPKAGLNLMKARLTESEQQSDKAWAAVGENLGLTRSVDEQTSRANIFNCLTQSPNHRSAMLDPRFNEIGIGWAEYPVDSPLADGMEDYAGPYAHAGVIVVHFAATAEQ